MKIPSLSLSEFLTFLSPGIPFVSHHPPLSEHVAPHRNIRGRLFVPGARADVYVHRLIRRAQHRGPAVRRADLLRVAGGVPRLRDQLPARRSFTISAEQSLYVVDR